MKAPVAPSAVNLRRQEVQFVGCLHLFPLVAKGLFLFFRQDRLKRCIIQALHHLVLDCCVFRNVLFKCFLMLLELLAMLLFQSLLMWDVAIFESMSGQLVSSTSSL
jgi:hypothetical protein